MIIDLDDLAIALGHEFPLGDVLKDNTGLSGRKFYLEAGCGSGKIGINLTVRTGAMGVLVDNDVEAVKRALANLAAVEDLRGIRLPIFVGTGDITDLPFDEKSFDLVFNEGVIEHFKEPAKVLWEMRRVSRGLVAAAVPNAENPKQALLAKRQTEAYAGKDHWAAYEKPMHVQELVDHMKAAGLTDIKAWHIWRDSTEPEERTSQYRLILGVGHV